MASLSGTYQDFSRQFEEHEKIDDPLFMRTHREIMEMQKRVNQWLQDTACRDDVSEDNSHVSRNSQRSNKSRHSMRSMMSNSSLEEGMKNKTKFPQQEIKAERQLKEAAKQLEITKLERELAVVKATDRIHLNFLD